ncbi:MAG: ABC transporter ATP-binding protein [Ruminococcus sp.]|jgi:ABC-2 type transport system ATP-binding protein|nr:ABC transporter ATP-binding protein [Ruminococcus sp.]
MSYIKYENVTKAFGKTIVLDNVNFAVERGEIVGFSGRNGSGKTLLFKMLAGLVRPTSGTITVGGQKIGASFLQDCGMLIETPGFIGHYDGFKNLDIINSVGTKRADREHIRELMARLNLDPDSKKAVSKYSLGMKQKLGIIQAVMTDPAILILDEPINSLDDASAADVLDFLRELNSEKKTTILIASHIKGDLDSVCGRVFRLSDNKVIEGETSPKATQPDKKVIE